MTESLYRKYRPQTFVDVVGQDTIERTLRNAVEHDKVSHAYLFCGPRGTGKTTTARLLAKALLCENGPTPDPDGTCDACVRIAEGTHPDVYELDAASRTGVENVREEIIGRVQFAPTQGRCKVYIIDEVHMLSTAAFNALLKTLEEPPDHVVFILCTTDPQKVPATIHSRCQRFDFHRISPDAIVSRLGAVCVSEDVEFEPEALDLIAHRADGGMRNALTSLEQLIAFGNGNVTLEVAENMLGSLSSSEIVELMEAIARRDAARGFEWTARYVETGADLAQFVKDLAAHVRDLYVLSVAEGEVALDISSADIDQMHHELDWFSTDRLARMLAIIGDFIRELRDSSMPRLTFEIMLTKIMHPESDLTLESLAERVSELEAGRSAVALSVAQPAGAQGVAPGIPQAQMSNQAFQGQFQVQAPAPQQGFQGQVQQGQPQTQTQPQQPYQQGRQVSAQRQQGAPQVPRQQSAPQVQPGQTPTQQGYGAPSVTPGGVPGSEAPRSQAPAAIRPNRGMPPAAARAAAMAAQAPGGSPGLESVSPASAVAAASEAATRTETKSSIEFNAANVNQEKLSQILGNQAALQRVWRAAQAELGRVKAAHSVLFLGVKLSQDLEQGGLLVTFPPSSSFAFSAAQKHDVTDALAAALEHAAGTPMPFRFVMGAQGAGAQSRPAAAAQPSAAPVVAPQSAPTAAPTQQSPVPPVATPQSGMPTMSSAGAGAPSPTAPSTGTPQSTPPTPVQQRPQGSGSPVQQPVPQQAPYEEPVYDEVPYGDEDVPFDESGSDVPGAVSAAPKEIHADSTVAPSPKQKGVADLVARMAEEAKKAPAHAEFPVIQTTDRDKSASTQKEFVAPFIAAPLARAPRNAHGRPIEPVEALPRVTPPSPPQDSQALHEGEKQEVSPAGVRQMSPGTNNRPLQIDEGIDGSLQDIDAGSNANSNADGSLQDASTVPGAISNADGPLQSANSAPSEGLGVGESPQGTNTTSPESLGVDGSSQGAPSANAASGTNPDIGNSLQNADASNASSAADDSLQDANAASGAPTNAPSGSSPASASAVNSQSGNESNTSQAIDSEAERERLNNLLQSAFGEGVSFTRIPKR